MKKSLFWFVAAALVALAACAEGPHPGTEPPVAPNQARLYIYRDSAPNGSQLWSLVSLDHQPLGSVGSGSVFYRDVTPGTYEIEVRSDKLYPDQFKTVRVTPGSRTFVKIEEAASWGQSAWQWNGTTFVVAIVNPAIGAMQIANLRLIAG